MIAGLLDHLWQSTLFAGGAWLMTLWLRRNPARLRFRLWFAASVKFLMPFAALSALGESLSRLFPATVPQLVLEIRPAAERLSAPAWALAARQHTTTVNPMPLLVCLWLAGFAVVLVLRLTRWLRLRAVMRQARDVEIAVPVDVKESNTLLEPGLVGILRPVVLLPEGLMPHLSRAERDAILAHEVSHFSSGDNITAAIHMLVEALFWFWPPVWLIGGRLIAERERACDESVLADGHDAEVYAQAILKVCRFCIQSPLPCASGASGADLSVRVRQIMSGEHVSEPGRVRRAMLATAMILVLALPVTEGFVRTPPLMAEMQQRVAAVKFQVAARIAQAATQVRRIAAAPVAPARARHRPRWKTAAPPQELPPQEQRMAALPPTPPDTPVADVPPPAAAALPVPASVTSPVRAAIKDVLVALYPQGNGDPDAVTCRLPETLPGSRLPGPKVCQTNRQWASLRARHEDITPDGASIILRNGSEQHAGYALLNCAPQRVAGSGIANPLAVPASFCF
jgi:beta-lactamase regulating signal transducer with metallopeptidase domain